MTHHWIYTHHLNPYILGPWQLWGDSFGIRWYSLPYMLGFLAIYGSLYQAVMRDRIPNADTDKLEESSLLLITSVIVGGRFGYFLLNRTSELGTLRGWLELPQVWHGGMAFFGAVAMVWLTEFFYCRKHRLGFWHGADRIMWVLAVALGFGRLANFVNGELYGSPTNGSWGVIFPDAELINGANVPRHPVQLYSALTHWLLGLALLWLIKRKPRCEFHRVPGFTAFYFLIGYGLMRVLTDVWRHEEIWIIPGVLNGGQLLSLLLAVVGVVLAVVRVKSLKAHGQPWDWYGDDGVEGDLMPEAHAWRDSGGAAAAAAQRETPVPTARYRAKGGRSKARKR